MICGHCWGGGGTIKPIGAIAGGSITGEEIAGGAIARGEERLQETPCDGSTSDRRRRDAIAGYAIAGGSITDDEM